MRQSVPPSVAGPDFRYAPPGNRESWKTFTSTGKKHLFVLETIVGGRRGKQSFRPEPGETVVALSPEGSTSFQLVGPRAKIAYTDDHDGNTYDQIYLGQDFSNNSW